MRSGTVELESGRWEWQLSESEGRTEPSSAGVRESAMGDAEPDEEGEDRGSRLQLEDPEDPRSRMSRRLPLRAGMENEAEVRRLARDPDERTLVDENGTVWRFRAVERPDAAREDQGFDRPPQGVRYASEGEPDRVGNLPAGRTLGEATREELLEVLQG